MVTIRKVSTIVCSELKAGQIVMSLKSADLILFRLILLQNSHKIVWVDSLGNVFEEKQLWKHFICSDDILIVDP